MKEPHGIGLDVADRLAFVAGAGNHRLAVVALTNLKTLGTYPVGDDPDVLVFYPGLKLLYVSLNPAMCGSTARKAEVSSRWETFRCLARIPLVLTRRHTMVYFPLEDFGGHPLPRIMEPFLLPDRREN